MVEESTRLPVNWNLPLPDPCFLSVLEVNEASSVGHQPPPITAGKAPRGARIGLWGVGAPGAHSHRLAACFQALLITHANAWKQVVERRLREGLTCPQCMVPRGVNRTESLIAKCACRRFKLEAARLVVGKVQCKCQLPFQRLCVCIWITNRKGCLLKDWESSPDDR